MERIEFVRLIKSLDTPSEWGYKYDDNCTDEWTPSNKQRRTSHYVFYLLHVDGKQEITLEHGYIRITHHEKKEQLIKKYTNWAKKAFNIK